MSFRFFVDFFVIYYTLFPVLLEQLSPIYLVNCEKAQLVHKNPHEIIMQMNDFSLGLKNHRKL